MQSGKTIRRVSNVSLWLAISGFLVALFGLAWPHFSLLFEGFAAGLFLIGLVGYLWSFPKVWGSSRPKISN